MDKEEIVLLAQDVYNFKAALKNMMNALSDQSRDAQHIQSIAHEHLREVLRILKKLLEKYPELQSTEMLLKAQNLILHVQSYGVKVPEDTKEFNYFVNQLATAFSVRGSKEPSPPYYKCLTFKYDVRISFIELPTKPTDNISVKELDCLVSEYLMGEPEVHQSNVLPEQPTASKNDSVTINGYKKQNDAKLDVIATSSSMTTFGVDLDDHLVKMGTKVPTIVTKCIEAVEKYGILVKGIYRVSGVKSRVERLCQEFEVSGGEHIDLSDTHPNIIANVLKLYLRQLPQPLFTFQLYPEFVNFAKNWPCSAGPELDRSAKEELKKLVEKLPKNYYETLTVLMRHLKKVSDADNNMSPSNLGIVFGPTLLRTNDDHSCMFNLLDTVHQTRVVELIIALADELFPPQTEQ